MTNLVGKSRHFLAEALAVDHRQCLACDRHRCVAEVMRTKASAHWEAPTDTLNTEVNASTQRKRPAQTALKFCWQICRAAVDHAEPVQFRSLCVAYGSFLNIIGPSIESENKIPLYQ